MPDPARLKNPMKGRYVLLDSIQDPGNIGTIIRTAAAAEVKGILLTKGCTDAYSDKAVRSSMGSILRIPVYENISLEFLQDLKKSGISFIGTALKMRCLIKRQMFQRIVFLYSGMKEMESVRKFWQ